MYVPMCLNCQQYEVAGTYAKEDGTGFCSAECAGTSGAAQMQDILKHLWEVVVVSHDENKVWAAFGALHGVVGALARTANEDDVKHLAKQLHTMFTEK